MREHPLLVPNITRSLDGNQTAVLDQWMEETHDLGAVPETELIRRGLVKNVLKAYEQRKTIA